MTRNPGLLFHGKTFCAIARDASPLRCAVLLRLRASRDFVSRRSAYTPHPASLRSSPDIHVRSFAAVRLTLRRAESR
jgi:hypothetical protein